MPIPRTTAQRLVSETEFRLINESFPPLVGTLSDTALLPPFARTCSAALGIGEVVAVHCDHVAQ